MQSSNIPLTLLVFGILRHTPTWVWGLLAALVALGWRQLREQRFSRTRLSLMPLALGSLSAWSAASAFGPHLAVATAWAAGAVASFAAGRARRWPYGVAYDAAADRFVVPGSAWPLAMMLSVFVARYATAVTLAFHPEWAGHAAYALPASAVYGALSGLFVVRTLNILGHARPAAQWSAA